MGVWKAKREARKSIWFRVPASLKQGFDELRQRAEAEGMCGGTFAAAPGTAGLAASRRVATQQAERKGTRRATNDDGCRGQHETHSNGARAVS